MNTELKKKAREAGSAEELLALAKENGKEITSEQAEEYYERLHAAGELSDEELDNVAGGGCSDNVNATDGCHNTRFAPKGDRYTNLCQDCIYCEESFERLSGKKIPKYTCKVN